MIGVFVKWLVSSRSETQKSSWSFGCATTMKNSWIPSTGRGPRTKPDGSSNVCGRG